MVIGLTGGIGAGKSLIRDFLRDKYDSYCIDMDTLAKDILLLDEAREKIIAEFGEQAYFKDRTPDKEYLSKSVFSDIEKRLKINGIIHPLVLKRVNELITENKDSFTHVVCESALPVEAKLKEYCDMVICVRAEKDIRIKRLKENRGYSDEKILNIFASQKDDGFFESYADYVLDNSKDPSDALSALDKILRKRGN